MDNLCDWLWMEEREQLRKQLEGDLFGLQLPRLVTKLSLKMSWLQCFGDFILGSLSKITSKYI